MPQHAVRSVLFVCLGNICRSPAGENVLRKLLHEGGIGAQVRCDSAGIIDSHVGEAPDARMCAAGQRRGLPMTGRARQVTREDLQSFDLILAMDEDNRSALLRLATTDTQAKIRLFCSYCTRHADREVPDPYYGGPAGFEYVLDLLEDGCSHLVAQLK